MTRVEKMISQGQSETVKLLEFIRIYSKSNSKFICIFEGYDEKYYSIRLTFHLGQDNWNGINAGGKKIALLLREILSAHPVYSSAKYICFIDKDFEYWLENPDKHRVYITPCYSIENLYVSQSCLKSILKSEFNISEFNEFSDIYRKINEQFIENLKAFNDAIYQFNVWAMALRVMYRDGKIESNINLKNVNTNSLVKYTGDKVEKLYNDVKEVFRDLEIQAICKQSLLEAIAFIDSQSPNSVFRGKQQLDFFRLFLSNIKLHYQDEAKNNLGYKGKLTMNLSKDNCISEISQYADTPDCLDEFLTNSIEFYSAA